MKMEPLQSLISERTERLIKIGLPGTLISMTEELFQKPHYGNCFRGSGQDLEGIAFQAEFEDVSEELTLMCRPAGEEDMSWIEAQKDGKPVKEVMEGFTAGNISHHICRCLYAGI